MHRRVPAAAGSVPCACIVCTGARAQARARGAGATERDRESGTRRWAAMMELRLALLLLGLTSGDAEPFLFMDLEDVQAPWGLLQPRASTVTRNDTFAPPCVRP